MSDPLVKPRLSRVERVEGETPLAPRTSRRPNLKDHSRPALRALLRARGVGGYRADQLAAWLYRRGVDDFGAMTDLSNVLREQLAAEFDARALAIVRLRRAADGTRPLLLRAWAGARGRAGTVSAPACCAGEVEQADDTCDGAGTCKDNGSAACAAASCTPGDGSTPGYVDRADACGETHCEDGGIQVCTGYITCAGDSCPLTLPPISCRWLAPCMCPPFWSMLPARVLSRCQLSVV